MSQVILEFTIYYLPATAYVMNRRTALATQWSFVHRKIHCPYGHSRRWCPHKVAAAAAAAHFDLPWTPLLHSLFLYYWHHWNVRQVRFVGSNTSTEECQVEFETVAAAVCCARYCCAASSCKASTRGGLPVAQWSPFPWFTNIHTDPHARLQRHIDFPKQSLSCTASISCRRYRR